MVRSLVRKMRNSGRFQVDIILAHGLPEQVFEFVADLEPPPLDNLEPACPRLARIAGVEGLGILQAVVRKDGTVGEVTVLKTPPGKLGFDQEAVAAPRRWRFRPGEMHGRPVDVIMTLTVRFRLDR
jgi:protein TonB